MALANCLYKLRSLKCAKIIKNSYILHENFRYSSSKSTTGGKDTFKTENKKKEESISSKKTASKTQSTVKSSQPIKLSYSSPATPETPSNPVGPGASKTGEYKNPEYFCYNELSYFDLELEMMKDRLPQPKSGNEMF